MKKITLKKCFGMFSVVMMCGFMFIQSASLTVQATGMPEVRNINLNTSYLMPSDNTWDVNDYIVNFGRYNNNATAYRVLEAKGEYLFLDCDTVLVTDAFDADTVVNNGQSGNFHNGWGKSDLEKWLNGSDYYDNASIFTFLEKDAIIPVSISASNEEYKVKGYRFKDYAAENAVFLLSAEEANTFYADDTARKKTGSIDAWWLRSAYAKLSNAVGYVNKQGVIASLTATCYSAGVSPALKVDPTAILFTSESGTAKAAFDATSTSTQKAWNLTLLGGADFTATMEKTMIAKDGLTSLCVTDLGKDTSNRLVEANYYSQISAMMVDENETVLAYGRIKDSAETGEINFYLPGGISKGNYKLHVFAEKVNSSAENNVTDYASNMVTFDITVEETIEKEKLQDIAQDTTLKVANGIALADMKLPEKVAIVTDRKTTTEACVDWKVSNPTYLKGTSYNPSDWKEQTFILQGMVICPEKLDANGVELTTQIVITVEAGEAPATPEPPMDSDEPVEEEIMAEETVLNASPDAGDHSNLWLWIGLCMICVIKGVRYKERLEAKNEKI